MATKKSPGKRPRESNSPKFSQIIPQRHIEERPEIALAAIVSSKKQKEVSDFTDFLLTSLDRNSQWLNNVVRTQNNFKCALMVGAGPNRFEIQEIIYPSQGKEIKLEVELKDSEDHDKIAIGALLKMNTTEQNLMMEYLRTRLHENNSLRDDLLRGKAMGIQFAMLRPIAVNQFRIMERIAIGSLTRCSVPAKKRREDKVVLMKKARKVA